MAEVWDLNLSIDLCKGSQSGKLVSKALQRLLALEFVVHFNGSWWRIYLKH